MAEGRTMRQAYISVVAIVIGDCVEAIDVRDVAGFFLTDV